MEQTNDINMVELRNEFNIVRYQLKQLKKYKKCANCGSEENIELHHIVPLIVGGTNKRSNIVALCQDCHAKIHGLNRQGNKNGIRTGMMQAAKNGKILVPGIIYGYDLKDNKLIPNTGEVAVIHKIFNLYLEGNGFKKIANYLNSNNILTKRGAKWTAETTRTILMQEKYIGISIRNKYNSNGSTNRRASINPKEDWIIYKYGDKLPNGQIFDSIPPIIDEQTFNAVQQRIKELTGIEGKYKGRYIGKSILAGKIKCGECGRNYIVNTWSAHGITHKYYICGNKHTNSKEVCSNRNVQISKLQQILNNDWICDLYFRKTGHNLNESYTFEQICKMVDCIVVNNNILNITITVDNIQLKDKLKF